MIRPPLPADIPRLALYIETVWGLSRLASHPLDRRALTGHLAAAVDGNGGQVFAVMAEEGEAVSGLFVGGIGRLYLVSRAWEASDLLWLGRGLDAVRMMQAFHAWAWAKPEVIRIRQSVVDTMGEMDDAATGLLVREGFRLTGAIFEKERER